MKNFLYWVLLSMIFMVQAQAMFDYLCKRCNCSKIIESCIKTKHKDILKLKKYVTDDDTIDVQFQDLDKRINGLKFHIQANIIQYLDLSVDVASLSIFTQIYVEYIQFQRQNGYPIKSLSNMPKNWYNTETATMITSTVSIWNDFELRTGIKLDSSEWKHFSQILKMTNMALFTDKRYLIDDEEPEGKDEYVLFEVRRNMYIFSLIDGHHWKIEVPTQIDVTNFDNKKLTIIPSLQNLSLSKVRRSYYLFLIFTINETEYWLWLSFYLNNIQQMSPNLEQKK